MRAHGLPTERTPVIIGGDFNSTWRKYSSDPFDTLPPGVPHLTSGVYDLLASETLAPSHADHPNQRSRSGPTLGQLATTSAFDLQSVQFACSGQELPLTHKTHNFQAALDYIWVSTGVQVVNCAAMPYEYTWDDPNRAPDLDFPAIPDQDHPSDHLSVACEVELLPQQA